MVRRWMKKVKEWEINIEEKTCSEKPSTATSDTNRWWVDEQMTYNLRACCMTVLSPEWIVEDVGRFWMEETDWQVDTRFEGKYMGVCPTGNVCSEWKHVFRFGDWRWKVSVSLWSREENSVHETTLHRQRLRTSKDSDRHKRIMKVDDKRSIFWDLQGRDCIVNSELYAQRH